MKIFIPLIFISCSLSSQVLNMNHLDNLLMFKIAEAFYENDFDVRRYSDNHRLLCVYSRYDYANDRKNFYVINSFSIPPVLPDEFYDLTRFPDIDLHTAIRLGQVYILHFNLYNFKFKKDSVLITNYLNQEFHKLFVIQDNDFPTLHYKIMHFTLDVDGNIRARDYPYEEQIGIFWSIMESNPERWIGYFRR